MFKFVQTGLLADAANVKYLIINGLGEIGTKYEPNFYGVKTLKHSVL